jgi:hypothetical protein
MPSGAYDIKGIEALVNRQLIVFGDHRDLIKFSPMASTLKCQMLIENGCQVDFTYSHSKNKLLGFGPMIYTNSYNISQHNGDIMNINTLYINFILIYTNNNTGNLFIFPKCFTRMENC